MVEQEDWRSRPNPLSHPFAEIPSFAKPACPAPGWRRLARADAAACAAFLDHHGDWAVRHVRWICDRPARGDACELVALALCGLIAAMGRFPGTSFRRGAFFWMSAMTEFASKADPSRRGPKAIRGMAGSFVKIYSVRARTARAWPLPSAVLGEVGWQWGKGFVQFSAPATQLEAILLLLGLRLEEAGGGAPAWDAALKRIGDRELEILRLRAGLGGRRPMSLKEIGLAGVDGRRLTRERVRQLEERGFLRFVRAARRAGLLGLSPEIVFSCQDPSSRKAG